MNFSFFIGCVDGAFLHRLGEALSVHYSGGNSLPDDITE